jgi:ADP-heptose:LPS heptosyltransferase
MFVVLHEGPADAAAVADVGAALPASLPVLRDPPLRALAGALHAARLYVGNDSGVSHLAAAVGTPSLVLFDPALLAWAPWADAASIVPVKMAELSPGDVETVTAAALALGRGERPA